jgi:hypothetical protein
MLEDEIERKQKTIKKHIKINKLSQSKLTCEIHDSGHESEITSYKMN